MPLDQNKILRHMKEYMATGYHVLPNGDSDVDVIVVEVDGTPTISWGEAGDNWKSAHGFDITGSIKVSGDFIASEGAEGTPSFTFTGFTDDGMWHPADCVLAWSLNGGEGMRLTGTGLGIGVTPTRKLHVQAAASFNIEYLYNTSTSSAADVSVMAVGINGADTGNIFIQFKDNASATQIGSIRGNGTGVNYNITSDERLKDNIENMPSMLETIRAMRPIHFQRKGNEHTAPGFGFSAQELYQINPMFVAGSPDDDPEVNPMGIDYGRLTPILVRGIQELTVRVEQLEIRR